MAWDDDSLRVAKLNRVNDFAYRTRKNTEARNMASQGGGLDSDSQNDASDAVNALKQDTAARAAPTGKMLQKTPKKKSAFYGE
jgi:hypothetical protein